MKNIVCGIVSKKEGAVLKYLLMNSNDELGEYTGFYYPVGGGVEVGETQEEALIREFEEEVHLTVLPKELIAVTEADVSDQKVYWWRCEYLGGELLITEDEVVDANFFSKEEMHKMNICPATRLFFDQYIFKS